MSEKPASGDSVCWAKAKEAFLEGLLSQKKPPSKENIDRFLHENFRLDKAITKCESLKMSADNQYKKGTGSRFVGKLLEVLVMVKEIGDPFLQFAPESVSIAWSAVSFLIQVGANDLENCGLIAEACTSITTVILNCRLYENRYTEAHKYSAGDRDTEKEIMNSIPSLLTLVLDFSWYIQNRLGEHKIFRSFKETFNPKLKDKYEEIQEEYKKLRSIAGDAFQERVMDTMDALSKNHDDLRQKLFPALDEINTKLGEISDIKQILSESQIREQFTRNRALLRPTDTHEQQLNIVLNPLSHETENLCKWLFEDQYYIKWETKQTKRSGEETEVEKNEKVEGTDENSVPPRICYIKGRPGFGKSVTVACALTRLSKPEKKSAVCYFFFKKGDDATQLTRQAIISIAAQMFSDKLAPSRTEMEAFNTVMEKLKETAKAEENEDATGGSPTSSGGLTSKATLKSLIMELGKNSGKPIYIILDAIDECIDYESEELIPWLLDLARCKDAPFKVLLSSRDGLKLEYKFDLENLPDDINDDDDNTEDGENAESNAEAESSESGSNQDNESRAASPVVQVDDAVLLTVSQTTNSADMEAYLTSSLTRLITRRMVNYRFGGGKVIDVSRMVTGIMKKANGMFTYSAMVVASLGQPSSLSLAERLRRLPDGMDELYRRRLEALTTEERKLVTIALKRIVWSFGDIGTVEIAEEFKRTYSKDPGEEDEEDDDEYEVQSGASESTAEEEVNEGEEEGVDQETSDENKDGLLHPNDMNNAEPTISVIDAESQVDNDDITYPWHQAFDDALNNPEIADTIYHLEQAGRDFFQFSAEKRTIDVIHKSVRDWVENESKRIAERDNTKVSLNSLFTWDEKEKTLRLSMPIPVSLAESPSNAIDFQSERDSHLDIAIYNFKLLNNPKFQDLYMPEKVVADAEEPAPVEGAEEVEPETDANPESAETGGDDADLEIPTVVEPTGDPEANEGAGTDNAGVDNKPKAGKNEHYDETWGEGDDNKSTAGSNVNANETDGNLDIPAKEPSEWGNQSEVEVTAGMIPELGVVNANVSTHFRYEIVQWGQHLKRLEELFEPEERVGKKWEELWKEVEKFFEVGTFYRWCLQYWMFAMNVTPEYATGKEFDPIQMVSYWGLTMVMEFILDVLKIDPDKADSEGDTALITAFANPRMTEVLLKHNVDVSKRGAFNRTAFQITMSSGDFYQFPIDLESQKIQNLIENGKLLIKAGADVNDVVSMPKGRPPFHAAITAGELELFELFMKHGVDVNKTDFSGKSALHKVFVHSSDAPQEDRYTMAKALIEAGADVNAQDIDSVMPLYVAVSQQHQTGVELLLHHGADIHDEDALGLKAIHKAASPENYEDDEVAVAIIDLLMENGAELKSYTKAGESPLDLAIEGKQTGILQSLVNKVIEMDGEDRSFIMKPDFSGLNLLHKAAGMETEDLALEAAKIICDSLSPEQVKEMLQQQDQEKSYTPLLKAGYREALRVVEYYISQGADVNVEDANGDNILDLLFANWMVDTLQASEWLPEGWAEFNNRMETLLISLFENYPVLYKDKGHVYLRGAIDRHSERLIKVLANQKIDGLIDDQDGWNCFDTAISHGWIPMMTEIFGETFSSYLESGFKSKQFPSPTRFSATKKSKWIQVSEDGLEAKEESLPTETHEDEIVAANVYAEHPVPPKQMTFYYEVTISLKDPDYSYVVVGLVADPCPTDRMPGLRNSETIGYAFHGDNEYLYSTRDMDDNHLFSGYETSTFKDGDVIGCGWNRGEDSGDIFFTKNGENLGTAWTVKDGGGGKLWPVIGAKVEFTAKVNFGAEPFMWKGLEELTDSNPLNKSTA